MDYRDQTYFRATVLGNDDGLPETDRGEQAAYIAESLNAATALHGPLHLVMTAKNGVEGEWIVAVTGNGPNSEINAKNIADALNALSGIPDPAALMVAVRECVEAAQQRQECRIEISAGRGNRGAVVKELTLACEELDAALRRLGEVMGK